MDAHNAFCTASLPLAAQSTCCMRAPPATDCMLFNKRWFA